MKTPEHFVKLSDSKHQKILVGASHLLMGIKVEQSEVLGWVQKVSCLLKPFQEKLEGNFARVVKRRKESRNSRVNQKWKVVDSHEVKELTSLHFGSL